MNSKFLSAIQHYNMLSKGDTVAVCLSGGADSMALFHLMCVYREKLGTEVFAIHINHGLREESAEEERFIMDYCSNMGVECIVHRLEMNSREKPQGLSTETWARNLRYEFFQSIAKQRGAKLATAHTLSDKCETVIFNLCRGTSLKGVCGIPAVRDNIIRPLIDCTREDVENYCGSNSIPYVTDKSNFSCEYSRNKIRLKVVPVLKEINSQSQQLIGEFTKEMEQIYTFLTQMSDNLYRSSISLNGFDTATILKQDDVVIKFFLRRVLDRYSCLSKENINDILEGIKNGSFSKQLSADIICTVSEGYLSFHKPKQKTEKQSVCVPVTADTPTQFLSASFCVRKISPQQLENFKKNGENYLKDCINCDIINDNLFLRTRKTGDTFTFPKRNVTKTVKKLFTEDKIPLKYRDTMAILSDTAGNVIWLEGYGVNKKFAVKKDTKNILFVEKL